MKRNKFSLSYTQLLSCNMGNLYPVGLTEVLPGDTIQQATSMLIRLSPLLAPVMHPVEVRLHHWFVPHRLVWEDWEDFITGGPDGLDDSELPTRDFSGGVTVGGLSDYYGIPPGYLGTASALPFRGYTKIWNEFYRDQDLQTEAPVEESSGPDATVYSLKEINWEKDYFTTARPWPQKGVQVSIPLSVSGLGVASTAAVAGFNYYGTEASSDMAAGTAAVVQVSEGAPGSYLGVKAQSNAAISNTNRPQIYATGLTPQVLREAFGIQRWEEARAKFGSRYTEYLRYYGVRSSDARLQRPEYLGGGRQTLQFSEVLQTAEGESPVGEMRGHGIAGMRSNRYRRFFEEHGYIHSLLSIRPKTIYTSVMDRTWHRTTREDFFTKELESIGQQEILNKEVKASHTDQEGVFGYQDRYDEYRRHVSVVSGEFRGSLLNYWHLARDLVTDVALNSDFVSCTPSERIFAVPSQDTVYIMCKHNIQARRMLAKVARPRIF